MSMKILLIGGTGNISTAVAKLLYLQGNTITTVTTGNKPVPSAYRSIVADRNNSVLLREKLSDLSPDIVIDFVAFDPKHLENMYAIFKTKIAQFIFISSATVYEKPHARFPITESTPLSNPFWPYAQQKIACEKYLERVHSLDFPVTIVRPSHTLGCGLIPSPIHGHDFTVANRIINRKPIVLHDQGESLWTLTAASDFAVGLCGLVGNSKATGESFHITSDEVLSWNQIYHTIGSLVGEEPIIEYIPSDFIARVDKAAGEMLCGDKKEHGVFDNQKIKQFVPNFVCVKPFKVALLESLTWLENDNSRKVIDVKTDSSIDRLIEQWKNNKP